MAECDADSNVGLAGLRQWFSPLPKLDLVLVGDTVRNDVEAYIQAKFNQTYRAKLTSFLPTLLTLRCAENLSGVAGIGLGAESAHLFLEHYLDAPIEQELARLSSKSVARSKIAEVGNLVATSRGASRLVFVVLASALHKAGLEWMVFTGTSPLIESLRRLGFGIEPIQAARAERLPESNDTDWGTYYQNSPQVVAGRLDNAMQLIADKTVYSALQTLFAEQIDALAISLSGVQNSDASR